MVLDKQNIDYIKVNFQNLETRSDLLELINYSLKLLYPNSKILKPIRLNSLTYYANPQKATKRYQEFNIKKKSGNVRTICAPVRQLKLIQRGLNLIFNVIFAPHSNAFGFIQEKSIVNNAKLHTNKRFVYNMDLKDFFTSIEFRRIKAVLEKTPPFNLTDDLAYLVANLCCHNGVLPQGAPTSPVITNIICQRLDKKLSGLAKQFSCTYSRYADDITFSSEKYIFKPNGKFISELQQIIKDQGFTVNENKTRLQNRNYRQEVTGIIVNEKTNLQQRYIRQVRAMLNNWEKMGIVMATETFSKQYKTDRGHVKNANPDFISVLSGKLEYMKMVRGKNDTYYQKYYKQFTKLLFKEKNGFDLTEIIEIWEKEGIEKAIIYSNSSLNKSSN